MLYITKHPNGEIFRTWKYTISTKNYTSIANHNYSNAYGDMIYSNNKIFLLGTNYIGINLNYLTVEPLDNRWYDCKYNDESFIPSRLVEFQTITTTFGILYIMGGRTRSGAVDTIYVYDIKYDYLYLSDIYIPIPRKRHSVILDNNYRAWIISGASTDTIYYSNDLFASYYPTLQPTFNPTSTLLNQIHIRN